MLLGISLLRLANLGLHLRVSRKFVSIALAKSYSRKVNSNLTFTCLVLAS
jgi:hypothetical protein